MSDNVTILDSAGLPKIIRTREIGGVHYQVTISPSGSTGTETNVSASASSVTVLAANPSRLKAWLYNDTDKFCYVKYGATASATSFVKKLLPTELFEVNGYAGIIDAIWESGPTGSMRVTELTA